METVLITALILAGILGLIPAIIASKKGRDPLLWWIFGTLLFIVALPCALLAGPGKMTFRKCPYCAEFIRREALVCKHCGSNVAVAEVRVAPETAPEPEITPQTAALLAQVSEPEPEPQKPVWFWIKFFAVLAGLVLFFTIFPMP